ncbi:MAG: tetratricopeptide repeat protein [Raineya sp.]|jgi:tetratricopeptide (TPR) repeat protein|nr:tetratricopeptide repeat protein [Raineya sp.]
MHRLFTISLLLFFGLLGHLKAQTPTLDSLRRIVRAIPKDDTTKAETMALMALGYMNYKPDSALVLAQQALKMSEKLSFKRGIARSLIYEGIYFNNKGDYDKALESLTKGLKISQDIKFTKGLADANLSIGFVYQRLSKNEQALSYYREALPMYEKLKDKVNIGRTQNNIGIIAKRLKKYDEAMKAYSQSLEVKRQIGDIRSTASTLNNMGEIFQIQGDTLKAFEYFKESLGISQKFKNDQVSAITLINLSEMSFAQKKYQNALNYAQEAQNIAIRNKFRAEEVEAGYLISESYIALKDYDKALENFKKTDALEDSLFSLEKTKAISNLQSTLELEKKQKEIELMDRERRIKVIDEQRQQQLIQLLEKDNNYQKSESARILLDKLVLEKENKLKDDEITLEKKNKALLKIKQEKERLQIEKEREKERFETQQERENFLRNIIYASLLTSLFIAFLIYSIWIRNRSNKLLKYKNDELAAKNTEINQQKEEILAQSENLKQINEELHSTLLVVSEQKSVIESKNDDIMASIAYAKRIQTAMLPFEERISASLKEYFILFKPKDIVSGDFYWFQDTGIKSFALEGSQQEGDKIILAVADCTGHGVPGAFMSMIGNELLNQIVNIRNITQPSEILHKLHIGIRNALKQETSDSRDGMDIVICTIDKKTKVLEFAGAKNPLYYVQDGVLNEIKGDKMSIGGEQMGLERIFANHTISLDSPITIYLCSDGYQDQFGGENNKKFLARNLRTLFEKISDKPINEQKNILDNILEKWMGNEKQTDDILIFGARIDL